MKKNGDFARAATAALVFCALLGSAFILVQFWNGSERSSSNGHSPVAAASHLQSPGAGPEDTQSSQGNVTLGFPADGVAGEHQMSSGDARPASDEPNLDLPDPASLSKERRLEEIAEWEAKIEREEAIERLNAGQVTESERKEYGLIFDRLVALKKVDLRQDLSNVEKQAASLARTHEERLAAAGLGSRSKKQ